MPNIKSSKKRVLTTAKKREENLKVKGAMKTAVKDVTKTTDESSLQKAFRLIDKALKKGIIKKNNAARKKSRLSKKVNETK